jgi:hypothetical protein
MNAVASEERGDVRVRRDTPEEERLLENQAEVPSETPETVRLEETPETHPEETQLENPEEGPAGIRDEQLTGSREGEEEQKSENEPVVTTRSGRQVVRPSRFAAVTKVSRDAWKEALVNQAIKKELRQLFEELVALVPVKKDAIPADATILNSHMFVVNKYAANGGFEKVKARLVANGRDQDPAMYPNKSSLTVALHSVFTVLGMAAEKRWWIVVKVDIKGAFVQTPM